MIRILIADDHAVVRAGLKQLLADAFPQAEFHESATIQETLELLRKGRWDLLLLDLFMPGGHGLGVLQDARRSNPRIPVLVFSSAPEEQLGLSPVRAGAKGYLAKHMAPKHLEEAVRKVLRGGKYISANLAEQLADEAEKGGQSRHEKLSRRELQVFHHLVSGQSLKEIAADLSLNVNTVRTFRVRLLDKLRLKCDVDLVHYALENGLVEKHTASRILPD